MVGGLWILLWIYLLRHVEEWPTIQGEPWDDL